MKSKLIFIVSVIPLFLVSCGSKTNVRVVDRPPTDSKNDFYIGNRDELVPSAFIMLPIGSIKPQGWLRKQLQLQADGFHGHLTEISEFLKKENNAWLSKDGIGERGWEEVPYWLKGYSNCAYVLGDEKMIAEAKIWIESALNSQQEDGWFGPVACKTSIDGNPDLWPNMIMLFCLQDYYSFTGEQRVIKLMTKYFKYLTTIPEEKFIVGYWPDRRGGDLLYSIYWLYNITGDNWLLDLAGKTHRCTARWNEDVIDWHNVNIAQGFKEPATYYMQSHDTNDLYAAERNWQKVRQLYGQVPGGMFGGDENCRPGFSDPRQAIETCGMVEEMLSDETLLRISGDPLWADRCENVAFNSLPAAFTSDYKALRYLTAPNMVLSDKNNKSPGLQNGGPMLLYNPYDHRCCRHNFGHAWPYYAENLWLATEDNGLAAVFFAASEVKAKVGDGTVISIIEKTYYPFDEKIEFNVSAAKKVEFPLYIRLPEWCDNPKVSINGENLEVKAKPLSFIVLQRKWSNGDKIALELPMKINVKAWTKNKNSVSVNRGPLTYSLKIGENYVRQGGTDQWPGWEIYPTTAWNYGLMIDKENPAKSFEMVRKSWPASEQPFVPDDTPIELKAKAGKIPEWKLDFLGLVGQLQDSPAISNEPIETITLIPMGAARLRISAFPVIGAGPNAHKWIASPEPAKPLPTKASHCYQGDTTDALSDNLLPKSSNDHSIPRFTFWDHRGTKEWVEYDFEEEKKISSVEVYWFDDTGIGQCRTPSAWKILYMENNQWNEVKTSDSYGLEKDKFNVVKFEPVQTKSLRLDCQLKDDFSGGILEWQVK